MPLTPFPNGLSSFGVPLVGSGPQIPVTTGKYWWVDSVSGVDANGRGTDPSTPFDSLAYALTKARAAKGDVIIIFPGHVEAITTAAYMNISKSGLTIVGLGNRDQRPTFTLSTVVGATVTVSGAETTIDNCIFNCIGLDNITVGITVTAAGVMFRNCKFIANDATKSVAQLFTVSADRFTLDNCHVVGTGADTGTTSVIISGAAIDQLRVINCDIRANASTALIVSSGSNHITNALYQGNILFQTNGTAKIIFSLTASSTGLAMGNAFLGTTWANIAANFATAASVNMRWVENYGDDDTNALASGVLVPAAGTVS